jgi:hypothetical protein
MEWQPFFPARYNFNFETHDERIIDFYSKFKNNNKNSNSILIIFEGGSGGGFLANCLSFSSKISSKINNKLEYLLEKLNIMDVVWDDFHLNNVIDENNYFFILDHPLTTNVLKYHLNYWKSPTVILFKNPTLFCKLRRCVWDVSGEICYDPNYLDGQLKDYNKFGEYNDKNQLYSFCDIKTKTNFYIWDTNWYFSSKDTIENLKIIYHSLDLGEFDEKSILKYYKSWINKINYLKTLPVVDNE